jgi:hypothetical protein
MDSKVPAIALTDRELALVQAVATERGISVEEAFEQLAREAIEQRFRKHTGRAPARVYPMRRNTK